MNKKMVSTGAIMLTLAIILGAFGAHKLKDIVLPERLVIFETGVKYQFYIAFIILILGLAADKFNFSLKLIATLLLTGSILFSGSIYLLTFQDVMAINTKLVGPMTPIGGLLMIIGLVVFILRLVKSK